MTVTVKEFIEALKKENGETAIQSIGTVSGLDADCLFVVHLEDGTEVKIGKPNTNNQ